MGKILVIKGADFSAVAVGKVIPGTKVQITVVASPTGGGTVTGSGGYAEGTTVTITATAATGYKFSKWSDGDTNATRQITVGSSAATYTAEFVDSKIYFNTLTEYDGIYGDVSTKVWKSGGQLCHMYDTLIKAGSVVTFGFTDGDSYSFRHGISVNTKPVEGEALSIAKDTVLSSITPTEDGYLYLNTPISSGYTPHWDDIKDIGYFTITEPAS